MDEKYFDELLEKYKDDDEEDEEDDERAEDLTSF